MSLRTRRRWSVLCTLFLLAGVAPAARADLWGGPLDPQPQPQPAVRAEDFSEFIGLNAAPFDRYVDAGRFQGAGTKYPPELFFDLGVRYYRTSLKYDLTPPDAPQRITEAFHKYGARPLLLIDPHKDGTPADIVALLKAYPPGVVAGVEGPNELNNKFPPQELNLHYKGKTDEAAGAAYMDDVYHAIKADPVTAPLPVIACTAIFTDYRLARPHTAFDFANMHSYQGADVPSSSLEMNSTRFNNVLPAGAVIKPFMPTECGYNVEEDRSNHNSAIGSLRAQARNVPMLLAEYFRHGIARAYLFALHNADGYGLLESDQATRRPAYFALKNFIAELRDATWNPATTQWEGGRSFQPRALLFDLSGAPATVHTLTLQKQSGQYTLLIWNEVRNFDDHRDLDPAPVPVRIAFQTPVADAAEILTPNDTGAYDHRTATVQNQTLALKVPSAVTLVKLTPSIPSTPATPATPAAPLPAIAGIQAQASETDVDLHWQGVAQADGYFVFRNGYHIATVAQPAYHDASSWIRPGLGYTYEMQAFRRTDGAMGPRTPCVAQVPDKRPDLIVTAITTDPPAPQPGAKVRLSATLKNIGDGATPRHIEAGVSFFIDGRNTGWSTRPGPMRAGESWVLTSGSTWSATPGLHTIKVLADDINRIPGERNKTNNVMDQSLYVGPPTPGLLQAGSAPAPGMVDLTAGGTLDWIAWGINDKAGVQHKAGGPGLFSALASAGNGYTDRTPGCPISLRWSDGAPTRQMADSHEGLWWNGVGHSQSFTVAADDTKTQVVQVYVGGIEGAGAALTAKLSDDSAPAFVSSSWNANAGNGDWAPVPDTFAAVYTIRYRAAKPGQTLKVEYKLTSEPNRFLGQARLQAATVVTEP